MARFATLSLALAAAAVLLAPCCARASAGRAVSLSCGASGSARTSIAGGGGKDYFGVISVPADKGPLFTLTTSYRITADSPACSPSVESSVVGRGAGTHPSHMQVGITIC